MMLALIIFNIFINATSILPTLFLNSSNNPMVAGSFVVCTAITTIALIFITPFFFAGIYGLAFLKMNLQKTAFNRFIYLAKNNYWIFFRISIAMGLIYILYWALFPRILALANLSADYFMAINSYSVAILSLLINLFFVFAYPLAIVGFFSNQDLKPIRSSFARVIRDFGKIKLIIALLVLNCVIGLSSKSVFPDAFVFYRGILLPLITTPITFTVLIYTYLLITDCFYDDLEFEFDKA